MRGTRDKFAVAFGVVSVLNVACDRPATNASPLAAAFADTTAPVGADAAHAAPTPPEVSGWVANDLDYGFISAAAAVVRLHAGTGIVLANGSDFGPQPVTMHVEKPPRADEMAEAPGSEPDWVSDDADYHSGVCVADLDNDGNEDVIVTVLADKFGTTNEGGIKVYYGTGKSRLSESLQTRPTWLLHHASIASCATGDLDADGFQDIVAASLVDPPVGARKEGSGAFAEEQKEARHMIHSLAGSGSLLRSTSSTAFRGSTRVLYDPKRGEGSPRTWTSAAAGAAAPRADAPRFASSVQIADVNGDGLVDVAVAGSRVAVYYGTGKELAPGAPPDWISVDEFLYAPSLDVVTLPPSAGLGARTVLVVSSSCPSVPRCKGKDTGTFVYQPKGGPLDPSRAGIAIWSRTYKADDRIAGPSAVLDVDRDGLPDVLTSVFLSGDASCYGGPIEVIRGVAAVRPFADVGSTPFGDGRGRQYETVVGGFFAAEVKGSPCKDLVVASASPLEHSKLFVNLCHQGD